MSVLHDIIELTRKGEALKRLTRTGWALAGVDCVRPESVGEHTFGTVLISLLISKAVINKGEEVDLNKVVSMAAFHDIPESITSDIPRAASELGGNLIQEGKKEAEKNAIQLISKSSVFFGEWLIQLWKELTEMKTIEARIVLGADLIDMITHAVSLESSGVAPDLLDQFFNTSYSSIKILELTIIEEVFWELYNEHSDNAKRLGLKIIEIKRK